MTITRQALLAQLEATRATVAAAAEQLEATLLVLAQEEEPEVSCPTCGATDGILKAGRNVAGHPEMLCPNNHSFVTKEAA